MNDPLLSTTTSFSRIRGFSIILLRLLNNHPLRTSEIIEITQKNFHYVIRYLYNLRNYGLIDRNEDFWFLTDLGDSFISYFISYLKSRKNNERIMKECRKNNERKNSKKEERRNKTTFTSLEIPKSRQINLSLWMKETNRDEIEKEVVEVLIDHYNKTGSKFIMVKDQYEFAEKLQVNPSDLPKALKNLRQDGIIYVFKDRTFNAWKIGIKKNFLELLEKTEKWI